MIFVCTGSQVYQFNRLLKELDRIAAGGTIKEEIFAQVGASDYRPQHYEYRDFLSPEEFMSFQDRADLIISHGGTGALIKASKKGKNIIAVPRLARFGEHTDDHQLQVVTVLEQEGYVRAVYSIEDLEETIQIALKCPITKVYNRESYVLSIISSYIFNS